MKPHTSTITSYFPPSIKAALGIYELSWRLFSPFLRFNKRLHDGWNQRRLTDTPASADMWLHAASAGEAYLVKEIVGQLARSKKFRILVTTNTRQGLDILNSMQGELASSNDPLEMTARYLPFDRPQLMRQMVDAVDPQLVLIMETELWPGLLSVLKSRGIPVVIVNGRINPSSLRWYLLWPYFWRALAPDRILAISATDALKFKALFNQTPVEVMSNIKFDQWSRRLNQSESDERPSILIPTDSTIAVFGSVRQAEENLVWEMMKQIGDTVPAAIIALFPRHTNRLDIWQKRLNSSGQKWVLRSQVKGPISPGTLILWDTFGELGRAYSMATAVFVGGSLAPLGGQNFLEPLACGIVPVIGPSWYNFAWVGDTIFKEGLVYRANGWRQAADYMIQTLQNLTSKESTQLKAAAFAAKRVGGTRQACRLIETYLD